MCLLKNKENNLHFRCVLCPLGFFLSQTYIKKAPSQLWLSLSACNNQLLRWKKIMNLYLSIYKLKITCGVQLALADYVCSGYTHWLLLIIRETRPLHHSVNLLKWAYRTNVVPKFIKSPCPKTMLYIVEGAATIHNYMKELVNNNNNKQ